MNYRRLTLVAALVCASFAVARPLSAGETRAVIELFTSQGCSSCPPADRLLGELARDPSIIAMTLPVDYWDYLGWKDTLAQHGHSKRQRAYSIARGDREVYTPQVVVNGVVHALGSDKAAIEKAIAKSRADAPLSLAVSMKVENDKVVVQVPAAGPGETVNAEVWLCPITGDVPVDVGRGENRGRSLSYHNVVRRWVKLGVWTGKAETFSIPLSGLLAAGESPKGIDRLTVVVQNGVAAKPGLMVGAATVALK